MDKKFNRSGFSLVETVVSLGLMAGVSYIVMGQVSLHNESKNKDKFNEEVVHITGQVRKLLKKPAVCGSFVQGIPVGSISGRNEGSNLGAAVGGEIETNSIELPGSTPENQILFNKDWKTDNGLLKVSKIQLVNDGSKDLIRITYKKPDTWQVGNNELPTVTKDILVKGERVGELLNGCEAEDLMISEEELCNRMHQSRFSPNQTEKCEFQGKIKKDGNYTLVPYYRNAQGELVVHKREVASVISCNCSSKRCIWEANCHCDRALVCPAPLITESPVRRVTRSSGNVGSERCDMEAECYRESAIPPGEVPVGALLVGP